jgi:RimJ/RimL family protein N-acetyltransferase
MLSPAYMSIYQQYKADTDSVAIWLATTAQGNGYSTEAAAATAQATADDAAKKK